MKEAALAIAAVLGAFAQTASAQSLYARDWIAETGAQIGQEVRAVPGRAPVAVRVAVGGSRRFNSVELVGTSGSATLDEAVLRVARRHRHALPPTELIGARVTFRITPGGATVAQASPPR